MELFFVAVAPPPEISAEISTISKDFAERFESVKSWKNFPHITLIPPLRIKEPDLDMFIKIFRELRLTTPNFEIQLKDFAAFANRKNPVIYIKPLPNEMLTTLQQEVSTKLKIPTEVFNPHLTVAYRDLSQLNFEKAWAEYRDKKFSAAFKIEHVGLYRHIDRKWQLVASAALSQISE